MYIEYLGVIALEKGGGPLNESQSWTAVAKEKARLTPPSMPVRESIDPPAA
jgi:hypothetical protein